MVWFAIGIESLCSIFLCVAAASNVSSQSWHPLALVLIIVLVGSTAHGIIATCKQLAAPGLFSPCRFTLKPCCLQCTAHKYFFVSVSCAFCPHPRVRGVFVLQGLGFAVRSIALVRTSITPHNTRTRLSRQFLYYFSICLCLFTATRTLTLSRMSTLCSAGN